MPIHSVFKRFIWWCAVLLIIILFCISVYRTGYALYQNQHLRDQFPENANPSPYQQGIQMENMDLTAFNQLLPDTFAPLGYTLTTHIETPVSIQYYNEIPDDEAAFALEIPKGAAIVAIPLETKGSAFYEAGYGYTSFPTYERGWRYVRPFVMADTPESLNNEQYYYVKIDNLEAVLNKVIAVNKPFRAAIRQQGWTIDKGTHVIARYMDNSLYQSGFYLSPDLFYRVFDRINVMLLGALGIIIAVFLLGNGAFTRYKNQIK